MSKRNHLPRPFPPGMTGKQLRPLSKIQEIRLEAEVEALDKIHEVLDRQSNKAGLTAHELAERTGLAIGRVEEVLRASTAVLRRKRSKGQPRKNGGQSGITKRWISDYSDLEGYPHPKRPMGRPRKSTGLPVARPNEALLANGSERQHG